ncbi:MAG: hypothetical protein AAGF15_02455 [Pseudomonadota bacterium]
MSNSLNQDVRKIAAWGFATPTLGIWPFVSVFPVFAMIERSWTTGMLTINILFFLTSFFAIAPAIWFMHFVAKGPVPRLTDSAVKITWLSLYALGWMTAYGFYELHIA